MDTKDPPGRGKAGQVGRELAWEELTRFEWSKSGAQRDRDANDDHSDLTRPNAGRRTSSISTDERRVDRVESPAGPGTPVVLRIASASRRRAAGDG